MNRVSCTRTERLATLYVCNELAGLRSWLFKRHLERCAACRTAMVEMREAQVTLEGWPSAELSAGARSRLRAMAIKTLDKGRTGGFVAWPGGLLLKTGAAAVLLGVVLTGSLMLDRPPVAVQEATLSIPADLLAWDYGRSQLDEVRHRLARIQQPRRSLLRKDTDYRDLETVRRRLRRCEVQSARWWAPETE